ncbi:MAG: AEC family transporter [Planctomycetes bacterium]|nr:AEC family transporter [Planctomycetota bacterium]
MTLILLILAEDILPVFLIAAVGFLLARYLRSDVKTLSRVTFNALSPCLVFHLLVTSDLGAAEFGRMCLFATIMVLGIGAVARLVTAPLRLDRAALSAFLVVVMFSNNGNYGLPVVLFAFGREALTHATVYFVTNAVLMFTVGVFLASAGRKSARQALAGIIKVPAVYGVGAAAVVMATGLVLPLAVMRPIELLSDAAVPVMLLVLGMQLDRAGLPERPMLVGLAAVLTLVVSPLMAFGLGHLLHLAGPARQAALLEASMPSAVVNTILALEFDIAPTFVTSVVFVSTMLSPITVAAVIALLSG